MLGTAETTRVRTIAFGLAAITLLLYAPMLGHAFIHYDDPDYITSNQHVQAGLTWSGIVWAFTTTEASNWHPLTWISHMLDCQLFGLHPSGHHLMNLLFHTANTVLLFLLLYRLTGAQWRSAFVAGLFAWHPMHVESVAWASERKDVLSAFFWMLCLLCYTRYAQSRAENALDPRPSTFDYFLALFLFACALLSKPMVVTLPFVLLLLDFWPLARSSKLEMRSWMSLLVEKIPFFLLSFGSCLVTVHAQHAALWSPDSLPLSSRLMNVLMSYVRYISKLFVPTDLALIYPYPHFWPMTVVLVVAGLLVLLTAIFILQAKRFPYLPIGWLWFVGTLVPAIGLVQVGVQSMADRYTYLPSIGLFILVVWGVDDLLKKQSRKETIARGLGAALTLGCVVLTSIQLTYWQNSLTIFQHTVHVTENNYAAYDCLGRALQNVGKDDVARVAYLAAVEAEPRYPNAQFDLGMLLLDHNQPDEASNHLALAVDLAPHNPVMQFDYGVYLAQHGDPGKAADHFRAALDARPDFPEARQQLAQLATNLMTAPAHPPAR